MEHARPPAELSLEGGPVVRSEAWRKWRKLFEVFLKASGVSKEPKEVQASLLVNLIGSAGYEVFTTFSFAEGESDEDIKCVLQKFDQYFAIKPNITLQRYKFFTRSQEEGENIDQYVTALRVLGQHCEFDKLHDSLLRDKIVCGIVNNTVRDRLLRTDDLSLSKAIQICQAAEISQEEGRCIDDGASGGIQVNAMQEGSERGARDRGFRSARGRRARGAPCPTCGSRVCRGPDWCPARNGLCFVCDRKGHFSRVCDKKEAVRKVLNLSVNSEHSDVSDVSDDAMFYVNTIQEGNKPNKSTREWVEVLKCNKKKIIVKVDTGSMINVISKIEYLNLGLSIMNLKPYTIRVHSFTGNQLPILGIYDMSFVFKNNIYVLPMAVADLSCQNVLGLEGCITLGLINQVNTLNLEHYSDLFNGLGKLPGKYSVVVDKSIQPVVSPARKIPLGLKDKLAEELLTKAVDNERNYRALMSNREKIKKRYDRSARPLEQLSTGEKVTLNNNYNGTNKLVSILGSAPQPRSYIVQDERACRYRRTRSQLIARAPVTPVHYVTVPDPPAIASISNNKHIVKAPVRRRKRITVNEPMTPRDSRTHSPASDKIVSPPGSSAGRECDSPKMPSPAPAVTRRSKARTARMLSGYNFE